MSIYLQILMLLIVTGAFGGFISSIYSPNTYRIKSFTWKPGKSTNNYIYLGFLGDIFFGMLASVAGFVLLGHLFGLNGSEISPSNNLNAMSLMRITGLGAIMGFAGKKIVLHMSSTILKKEDINEIVEDEFEAHSFITRGDFYLESEPLTAMVNYENALQLDPNNETAAISVGKALKKLDRLDEAISKLNDVITKNSKSARAFYNRACYKNLLRNKNNRYKKDEVLEDLKRSVDLFSDVKKYAVADPDLSSLHSDLDFKKIVAL